MPTMKVVSDQVMNDPFFPRSSGSALPEAPADCEDLSRKLPALHRRNSGGFFPLARAVADVMGRVAAEISFHSRALKDDRSIPARAGGLPAEEMAGTARGLKRLLSQDGSPPQVWTGVVVAPAGDPGELVIKRSFSPSTVLAWPPETEFARCDPARVPPGCLPPCGRLQIVRLLGHAPNPLISGDRFRGELLGKERHGD